MISVKGVSALGGIAAFGAVSAMLLAPPASADEDWSAIAYSPSTGAAGYWRNSPQKAWALTGAWKQCDIRPENPTDCEMVMAFNGCGAFAVDPDDPYRYTGGFGGTIEEANNDALSKLSGVTVRVAWCNGPGPSGPFT